MNGSGEKFGAFVRRERERKEIGLREMAKMIGVSPWSAIGACIAGCSARTRRNPPPGFRSEAQPLKKSGFERPFQARQSRLVMAS